MRNICLMIAFCLPLFYLYYALKLLAFAFNHTKGLSNESMLLYFGLTLFIVVCARRIAHITQIEINRENENESDH